MNDQIIIDHIPLVKVIARRFLKKLPSHIHLDDLISSGYLGLIDAAKKFDPKKEVDFKNYAEFRIKGAIIDELRSVDPVSRSLRKKEKVLIETYKNIENKELRPAKDEEVANNLGIDIKDFYKISNEIKVLNNEYCDNILEDQPEENNLIENFLKLENAELIKKIIDRLPEKEKNVIFLYYYKEMTMKEIGFKIGYTESRISQIHSKAILRLKKYLKGDNFMAGNKNNQIIEKDGKIYKICYECNDELEMNITNFPPNQLVKGGFENQCRKCKNLKTNERNKRKRISNTIFPLRQIKEENVINLDLTEIINSYPAIYKKLQEQAKEEMRPIEHHALYLIKIGLNNENS